MRKSRLEKLREAQVQKAGKQVQINSFEELCALVCSGSTDVEKLRPTQKQVLLAPASEELIAYMGHAGAAKTSTGVASVLIRAFTEPGFRGVIARQNYNDLKGTTLGRAQELLRRLPPGTLLDRTKDPPEKWVINPAPIMSEDPEPSHILFMGLDVDADELGSLEFNGAFIDEADEIKDESVFLSLMSRFRLKTGGPTRVVLAFNAPAKTHWLYTACTGLDAQGRKVREPYLKLYKPVKGENEVNLAAGYYDKLRELYANRPDLLARLVDGDWVAVFKGMPVYPEFRRSTPEGMPWHVRRGLKFDPYGVLFRGWDFGYNQPRCIFAQLSFDGHLHILGELVRQCMEIRPFVNLVKVETATRFRGVNPPVDFGDPACDQHSDKGSTLVHLAQEGVTLRYIRSKIDGGLRSVRNRLDLAFNGAPALQFDESCTTLIEALGGGYRMREGTMSKDPEPLKDGFYDNSADAFRYLIINLFGVADTLDPNMLYATPNMSNLPDNLAYDGS